MPDSLSVVHATSALLLLTVLLLAAVYVTVLLLGAATITAVVVAARAVVHLIARLRAAELVETFRGGGGTGRANARPAPPTGGRALAATGDR